MPLVEGIILRTYRLNNNYCFCRLLTKFGLISFSVSKAIRQKFQQTEELTLGEFDLRYNRSLTNLEMKDAEIIPIESVAITRKRFYSLKIAQDIVLDTYDGLDANQFEKVYESFLELVRSSFLCPKVVTSNTIGFLAYYRKLLGCSFEINQCSRCGNTISINGYSLLNQGFVCANCFDPRECISISEPEFRAIRRLFESNELDLNKLSVPQSIEKKLLEHMLLLFQYDFNTKTKIRDELLELLVE